MLIRGLSTAGSSTFSYWIDILVVLLPLVDKFFVMGLCFLSVSSIKSKRPLLVIAGTAPCDVPIRDYLTAVLGGALGVQTGFGENLG